MPEQDFLGRLRVQAQRALHMLEREIERLEANLSDLRAKAAALGGLSSSGPRRQAGKAGKAGKTAKTALRRGPGRPAKAAAAAPAARRPRVAKKPPLRTTEGYAKLLEKLPTMFSKEDLHKAAPDFAARPKAGVMTLARWSRAKAIKKVGEGKYRKL